MASDCQVINWPWQGPFIKPIGENKWVYAMTADQQVQLSCVTNDRRTQTQILKSSGILELPNGCSATGDTWILLANLRQQDTPKLKT